MAKKPRIGSDPLSWIQDSRKEEKEKPKKPVKQHTSKTVSQHTGKTAKQQTAKKVKQESSKEIDIKSGDPVKATFYIRPEEAIKELKHLSIDLKKDLSELVSEAIIDLIKKYKGTEFSRFFYGIKD